jgi:hypothetical protein
MVEEHVGERVPDLGRRAEHVRVVAVGEHRPAPAHVAVQALREPDREALHPLGQGAAGVRLDDEVQVGSCPSPDMIGQRLL